MNLHPRAVEVLESQKDALAQLLAILLFETEADATGTNMEGKPLDSARAIQWARDLRRDMQAHQPELLEAARRHTGRMNTHLGFMLKPLLEQPADVRALSNVYFTIGALKHGFAAVLEADRAAFEKAIEKTLISAGHSPEVVRFAMENP